VDRNTLRTIEACKGRTITRIWFEQEHEDTDVLCIGFSNGTVLKIWDRLECCEKRYMRTDDNLDYFVGARFKGVRLKGRPKYRPMKHDYYDTHGVQFMEVETNKGSFVIANHDEFRGNYAGFNIQATIEDMVQ